MKRITKIILSLILTLAVVALPLAGNAASYKADEATTGTQGVLTAANYYDYNFSPYQDIVVWASEDTTATLLSITGQPEGTFAWFYNFVLEYNEENGTWVVTKADMTMADAANQSESELLGPNKMVIMFHDLVTTTQQENYDFFINTVEVGQEYYLGVHPSAIFEVYDKVDGVFLSTVPVEVEEPETESEAESEATSEVESEAASENESEATSENENNASANEEQTPTSPLVIVTVIVVLVAIAGVIIILVKRKGEK